MATDTAAREGKTLEGHAEAKAEMWRQRRTVSEPTLLVAHHTNSQEGAPTAAAGGSTVGDGFGTSTPDYSLDNLSSLLAESINV